MYLAGVSVRRVEDITEALWGSKVSPATISELNKKAYVHIEDWRNRPLQGGRYPYVYVDGIYLRRNWGGEFENVAILVAIAVNEDGYREVLGAAEGMKEDKSSWLSFFQWLRSRGLDGVKLIVGDKCLGMLEAVGEVFPEAKYQRCTVHFYRNVFSVTPRSKVKLVAKMLGAIHAQESKRAAREKAKAVVEQLRSMKLKEAAKKVEAGIEETLTYCDFPSEHWTRIRTNNGIERLNREIRRALALEQGEKCYMISRVRKADDTPMAYEEAYIPFRICPNLQKHIDESTSLYEVYENEYHLKIGNGHVILEAVLPSSQLQAALKIGRESPLLYMRCTGFLENGTPFYYVDGYYIGEKYEFSTNVIRLHG